MSTNLYWQPVINKEKILCDGLKFIIRDAFFGGLSGTIIMNSSNINYLVGVKDGAKSGFGENEIGKSINILLDAIDKYEKIQIRVGE